MISKKFAELTTALIDTPKTAFVNTLHHKNTESKEAKRIVAEKINRFLEREMTIVRRQISDTLAKQSREEKDRIEAILSAIEEGDETLLQEYGFIFYYVWFKDLLTVIIEGKTPLEVDTILTSIYSQFDIKSRKAILNPFSFQPEDVIGFELSAFFKRLSVIAQNIRIVIDIDDSIDSTKRTLLPQQESDPYFLSLVHFTEQKGIITPGDINVKDYLFHRYSNYLKRVDLLIERLRKSNKGRVSIDDEGNVYFHPDIHLVTMSNIQPKARVKEMLSKGILLKDAQGFPTKHALFTSSFLDPLNAYINFLFILDKKMRPMQTQAYILLRAMNIVQAERYHNISFDSQILSADLVVYGIGKTLQKHIHELLLTRSFYNDWSEFDSYEYVERNYDNNGEILQEDKALISHVIKSLKQIGIAPKSLERVADVGTGPNLYPVMLLSPYVKAGSKIDALEFSPNRAYLAKVIGGTIEPKHASIWHKFEQYMVEVGGELYLGCEDAAKKQAKIQYGDIFDLPKNEYDLISSYFVAESIVDSQLPFREAIKSLGNALKENGILIVAHMVGSEGWLAGEGTHFPAVNLSVEQIKAAYFDANMNIISMLTVDHNNKKIREGYHGMMLVIAHPK